MPVLYLAPNFQELARRHDQGPSASRPICVRNYDVPVVRPSGPVTSPNGWLHPAMVAKNIPPEDRRCVGAELFGRLRALLHSFDASASGPVAISQFWVYDSAHSSRLTPAQPEATGISGDWVKEIDRSPAG